MPPTPYPQILPAPPPSLLDPTTGEVPLKALLTPTGLEILYYAQISLGTPQQLLTVDIDTGSADAWIPVECWQCANKEFIPERSTTYSSDGDAFDVSYGSGDVSGIIASEVVSLASLSVSSQSFGAVNRVSAEWNEYPNDGLIGLAFSTISVSSKPTVFENLILQEKVAAPSFSIFLARGKEDGSSLCLGCWDPLKVSSREGGRIYWASLMSKTYWSILMDGVIVNGQRAELNLVAAIDTGTTLIYLPELVAAVFYKLIPGAKPSTEYGPEFYTFPCYGAPIQIAFSFEGQPLSINMMDFNLGRTSASSSECIGGIVSLGRGFPTNLAIVGDEFLKSWYTTFDYSNGGRVGFARSANEN
ncbi:aspartic peptidase domain-containing protein [Pterulicium gracile]|uniref:Aspartic peptidase domain-containing protein n=1 Tax=Pterulicium gracile TaxID=1884261 RepID=A0A5C3QRM2_9AGAR|nr:aspartic peptidase domain-containing protein [Pterula gracilis]